MNQKTILVIEDDKDILTILKDQLELDGFSVAGASMGDQGIKLFKKLHPDLVILDLNLPDMDGIKVCQLIRRLAETPIIMLTARETISDKVRGFECGADDYIVKPFEYLELQARIKACLRRTLSGIKKEGLQFGPLKILPQKMEVFLNDQDIKLTKKEFELLELLISNPDKVLERDFICRQLWPNGEVYTWSRALDVHIRRLRQKIEPDPDKPQFIITHTGVGYRFQTPSL